MSRNIKCPTKKQIASLNRLLRVNQVFMQYGNSRRSIRARNRKFDNIAQRLKNLPKIENDADLLSEKLDVMTNIINAGLSYNHCMQIMQLLFNPGESASRSKPDLLSVALRQALYFTHNPPENPYFLAHAELIKYLIENGHDVVRALADIRDYDYVEAEERLHQIFSAFLPSINIDIAAQAITNRRNTYATSPSNMFCAASNIIARFPVLYKGKQYDLINLVLTTSRSMHPIDSTQVQFDRTYALRLKHALTSKNMSVMLDLAKAILRHNFFAEFMWLGVCALCAAAGYFPAHKLRMSAHEMDLLIDVCLYAMIAGSCVFSALMQIAGVPPTFDRIRNQWITNLSIFNLVMAIVYLIYFLVAGQNFVNAKPLFNEEVCVNEKIEFYPLPTRSMYGICLLVYGISAELDMFKTPTPNLNGLGIIPPMHVKKCSLYAKQSESSRALTLSFNRLVAENKVGGALAQKGIIDEINSYVTPKWRIS